MGYYHVPLDEYSQQLCTTALPWGLYSYMKLPMGISPAPDIFQGIMAQLFSDFDRVNVYLDDILIMSSGTLKDHLEKLEKILHWLQKAGFAVSVQKSLFAGDHVDYLGYHITRQGLFLHPKKVEAIHKLTLPENKHQLRRFLGMVNYYHGVDEVMY